MKPNVVIQHSIGDTPHMVVICIIKYSPGFTSNLGTSLEIFMRVGGQEGLWRMGSFINQNKSRNSNEAKNGKLCIHEWILV